MDGRTRGDEIAAQVVVKLVNWYSALPEHKEFAIVEADSATKIAALAVQVLPSEQSKMKVTPLATADEELAMASQMGGG